MEIYALVGKSGSGKSFKSHVVAGTHDIEYVIDDGLLIKGTKIMAGISAKRERTKFGAVRRAIFKSDRHREQVKKTLLEHKPAKLLVIGTSEHMIQSILQALELEEGYQLIRIEDISTPEEIELAFHTRRTKGKHVIPVPTFEVKKAFSGYFIDSVRHWARKGDHRGQGNAPAQQVATLSPEEDRLKEPERDISGDFGSLVSEATVVRPTFSYLGSYEIKDGAIKTIIGESATEVDGVARVNAVNLNNEQEGMRILITVTLGNKGNLCQIVNKMAVRIGQNVEHMTGINVLEVNTIVKSLVQ